MTKPKVLIFAGYGLNCDSETAYAFKQAGAKPAIIHINDCIDGSVKISDFQIIVFQGGFSYGDDTGSGNAFALKVKNHLWKDVLNFLNRKSLIIGICNGFQILVNLGLLPAFNNKFGKREVALINNENARYNVRFVDLKIENNSPWLTGLKKISLPVAHGEGNFYAPNSVLQKLKKKNMIALRYIKGEICKFQDFDANPNGSLDNIAGISDESGRILGLMPHPERAQFNYQRPNFWYLKNWHDLYSDNSEEGPGIAIFRNGINYFKDFRF